MLRIDRILRRLSPFISCPLKEIRFSDKIKRVIAKASDVFPDPDSPTTPNVSPSLTDRVASLTAFTCPIVRLSSPRCIGNQTLSFSVARSSGAFAGTGSGAPTVSASKSNLVYGCSGTSKICEVLPLSTTIPRCITITLSAILRTTPKSWVIKIKLSPSVRCNSFKRSRICASIVTSSAVVGSSAINSSGSLARAIAIITRCLCPPESWCGYDFKRMTASGIPTFANNSKIRSRRSKP